MDVVFSIISHDQNGLVRQLLDSLDQNLVAEDGWRLRVVLTHNTRSEGQIFPDDVPQGLAYEVTEIVNLNRKGFGGNHNKCFEAFPGDYFCIINPDILFKSRFRLSELCAFDGMEIGAPRVLGDDGKMVDYLRDDITMASLVRRILKTKGKRRAGNEDFDWIAGMFLSFHASRYRALNGFDERFFMYVEDCDLCRRHARSGGGFNINGELKVQHDARRESRRSARFLAWHVLSIAKYLLKKG